jgi:hypothetical protein
MGDTVSLHGCTVDELLSSVGKGRKRHGSMEERLGSGRGKRTMILVCVAMTQWSILGGYYCFVSLTRSLMSSSLSQIPVEVFLDNILPLCSVPDILSLGSTNRFFALVTSDDTFWKRKLDEDFNFPDADTARTTGWKFIYQGMRNPRVFVWGYVVYYQQRKLL